MTDIRDIQKAADIVNKYKASAANNNAPGNVSNNTNSNKSAYQANLSQPTQTQPKNFSTRFIVGQIATLGQSDPSMAKQYYQKLQYSMADPNSHYYNPYNQPTNRAVSNLAALGFDTNNLNDDWFNANQGWISSNLSYTGTTNSPSKPGKKATRDQNIAYELYQWHKSEDTTKKAEQEWQALQDELTWMAKDNGRNYSDDKIMELVYGEDGEKLKDKYPTLFAMGRDKYIQPTELNRGIEYSKDAMYGVLWAARNPEYQGNIWGAMANSALGTGNQYVEDPEITAKLNWSDKSTYAPYSVGSTLVKEGKYFGCYNFGKDEINNLKNGRNPVTGEPLDPNDETSNKMVDSVLKAEDRTVKAEQELAGLNEEINKWIGLGVSENIILNKIDSLLDKCPTLLDMDKSLEGSPDALLGLTRAVDYKKTDFINDVKERIADRDGKGSGVEYTNAMLGDPRFTAPAAAENTVPENRSVSPAGTSPVGTSAQLSENESGIEGWANYSATNTGPDGKPLKTPTDLIPGTQAGANNEPVALTSQDIETIKAKDAMVANALPAIEGDLTESEQALLTNGGSTAWDYMKNVFSYIRSNVDRVRGLAQDSYDASMKSYIEDNLDAAFAVGKYNVISDNLSADQDKLLEYQRKYGDLENYYSEVKDSEDLFDPELDAQFYFEFNRETNRYEVNGIVDQVDGNGYSAERTYGEGTRGAELVAKANALAEEKTKKARQILTAQIVMNTPEGKAEIEAYGALAAQVEEEKKYVKENDLAYEEKNTSMQNARAKAGKAFSVGRVLGVGNSDDLAKADAIVEYLSNYYNQPQLPASGVTPLQAISRSFEIYGKTATREEMSGSIHQSIDMIDQAIALDEELLAYVDEQGIKIPDVVRRNLQFELEDYRNERQAFAYSSILTDTDPEELEKAIIAGLEFEEKYGKEMEAWDEIFSDETTKDDQYKTLGGKLRFMEADFVDDDDKKIYYYLLGQSVLANGAELEAAIEANDTYGIRDILDEKILKTSNDFVSFMDDDDYGVWTSREKEQLQESAKEMVDSGFWGGALANIGATLSTPLESILSGVYMLDKAVSGERINPDTRYRLPSVFKESTRAETRKSIQDTFGEGTFESWLANLGYEIYCNRGDSLMNQLTFGPLLGGSGMRGEFTGSMPMGASAALNAAAEAVENGANVDQAWLIAGATFIAETATEAITYSNIRDALGTAEELTTETLTGFVRKWLLKSGLEEVGGEVTNNIVERLASEIAARMEDGNYQSDHDRLVEQYIAQGKLPDEAEQLARLDEFKEDVHTAIVSYLSAGTDVFVQTGKAAANTFNYYRSATRNAQQNYGDSRSMLRHMLDDYKVSKYIQSTPPTPANGTVRMQDTEQTQNAPAEEQTQQTQETQVQEAQASPAAEQTQEAPVSSENLGTEVAPNVFVSEEMDFSDLEKEYAQDIETLDSAIQSADSSAISAGIASVIGFDASDAGSDQANAAAIRAVNLFKNGADDVSDILYGGFLSKVDAVALKSGIQFAALGGENSECYNLTQTEQFMNATPEQKALMLAQASVSDARNTAVQQNVAGLVKENRLAEAAKTVIANGSMAGTMKAQEAVNDAQTKNRQAKADLETRQAETQAASDNREAADKLAIEDPLNEKNEKAAEQARQKLTSTIAVEQEYEQHAENAQRDQEKAEANLETVKQQEITNTRQQSDQIVAEVDQQRADQAAQIAEQQRIEAEQAAQAQAEEDQRSGKKAEADTLNLAEDWANTMHLEGEERDTFIARVQERQEQKSLGQIDMTGKVSNAEGYLAIQAFARKTGLNFELSDKLPAGTREMYQNGTVYLNSKLVNNGSMTIGQALVEASLHGLTHGMESTDNYQDYKNIVLDYLFGAGDNRDMDAYNKAIADKRLEYYRVGQDLTNENAEQEIIADFARLHLADKDVVQRFMDAGLGGKIRNALHNINQAMKNFYRQLKGEDLTQAEYLRRAERAYQKAINEVANGNVASGDEKYSVNQMMANVMQNFEYMKTFAEQLHDFVNPETRKEIFKNDSLLVSGTPELFKEIGFPSLPVVINQEHTGYALDGTYPNEAYRKGHTFSEEEFAKLPEKIADPVAITYDPRSTKQFTVYIDMYNTEGDKVIVPLRIGAKRYVGGKGIQSNALLTVFEQTNGENQLISAIKNDSEDNHSLLYLNKEKALSLDLVNDNITIVQEAPSGINHMINQPDSKVNTDVKSQTDTKQFQEWFDGSKVTNDDGSPMIVYHGTSEQFTAFDMSKGRSTMDIQGAFFSPYEIEAGGYGENVGEFYLSIKNPASEGHAYEVLNMFKGQNEAGKKAREYLINEGYDGVKGYDEFIAFYPEQIKSATDNIGTFDNNNPDYRYSVGGEITDADIDQRLAEAGVIPQLSTEMSGNVSGMPVGEGGNAQRQFGRYTAQTSDALHDDVKEYLYKHSSYTPDTNQAQIDRAISWVQSNASQSDPDGFFSSLQKAQNGDFDSISADGQARMLTLMGMAALKGEETGDHSAELTLADLFNKQGTEAGRALQARKMFRLMTPVGRMATLNKMADQINEEYGKKGNEHRVRLSDWTLQAAAVAESEEDFQKVQKAAAEELASQMPANWKEKFTAIRMLSMLGNPRTHIRNLVGNLAFMPAVGLKNKIGAGLEAAFVKNGDRTKTIGLSTPESRAFAKQYAKQIEGLLRGESKYNEGNAVQQERKIFGQGNGILSKSLGRLTQFLVDANGNALETEDWIFLNRHFRNAFAGYMTANGLTEADMKGDTLDKATAYAINEAHKATYRDANEVANWMNKVKNPAAKFVINAVLPFKKTPMNILKRGVEYSPVSIIRSLTSDAKHLKQWQAYQNGELSVLPEKAISPSQYIDRLSAGLSGTAFVALGALLSSLGFLRSGMDDDDDELDKLNGSQEYSLEIGGVSFTIDWAAPICMPLFVGATIMDEVKKAASGRGEDVSIGSVLDAVLGIAEPVTQLSMLDGLNSVLNPSNYGDTDSLIQVGEKVITNYATSYVPTLFGQVARTIDTTRRRNFVESGADLKVFRSALEQVENKIPFLSQKNIPYRNVWGEADVSPQGWAAIENFLSPGYGNTLKNDPVTNELKRIYQETGNPSMIPKAAGKTVTINGKNTPLTAEQYDQYVVDRGQTAYNCIKDLMESPVWQICDDDTRALMITDAWNYANQIGRHNVDNRIKKDSWVANAEHNGNFVDVAIERAADSNRTDYIKGYGQTMAEALDSNDSEMFDLSVTALEEAGATDTEIRGALRDYFKPLYQVAFEENDKNTMELIEEKLLDADVGFKGKDIAGWIPSEAEEKDIDQRWLNEDNYNR